MVNQAEVLYRVSRKNKSNTMKNYFLEKEWNILAITYGIVVALFTFLFLGFLSLLLLIGMFMLKTDTYFFVIILISSGVGGFITGLFSTKRTIFSPVIVGLILTAFYFLSPIRVSNDNLMLIIAIITSTVLGSLLANLKKIIA